MAPIVQNEQFANLTQAWLVGNDDKAQAMRSCGVPEHFITGHASDWEKFAQWAATVPRLVGSPLYTWTHLELHRHFGVNERLDAGSARRIYEHCGAMLHSPEYSARNLLRRMQVQVLCSLSNPSQMLDYCWALAADGFESWVLPVFCSDNVLAVTDSVAFNNYLNHLGSAASVHNIYPQ
ncbi:MAG: glucuronate isomerase [Hymenobacter sp.]|nr:glucuronate isomerase [Hymenobacter sp.]